MARTACPTSDFRLPTSDFRLPTSDFRLPTSDLRLPTSDLRPPTTPRAAMAQKNPEATRFLTKTNSQDGPAMSAKDSLTSPRGRRWPLRLAFAAALCWLVVGR